MKQDYHVLIKPDTHCPNHDQRSLDAVLQYVKDHQWDECVDLGDLADMPSMFTKLRGELQDIGWRKARAEMDAPKPHLNEWRPHFDKYTWIEGNHEARIGRWVAANNQDPLEWRHEDMAASYEIEWVPFWSSQQHKVHKIGKATFIHGCYVNQGHPKSHAQSFDANVFYGHTHDALSWSLFSMQEEYPRVAQSLGCLSKFRQTYHRGRPQPTRWQQAFGEMRFKSNGWFSYTVYHLTRNRFWVGDREYAPGGSVRQSSSAGLQRRKK